MITLSQKLKRQQEPQKNSYRISVRDKLLAREIQEMSQLLPSNCTITYNNINDLSAFVLIVKPSEGFWQDGNFKFSIQVTEEYNMVVSTCTLTIINVFLFVSMIQTRFTVIRSK